MEISFSAEKKPESRIGIVALASLIVLFVLRIFILGILGTFVDYPVYSQIVIIYIIGTYIFTALFIWMERNRLADYHIDAIAVIIIALGPLMYQQIGTLPRILMAIVGAGLVVGLLVTRTKLGKISLRNIKWILIGIAAGVLTGIAVSYFRSLQVSTPAVNEPSIIGITIIFLSNFSRQLLNAAVFEEPFFRGCLWGVLKKYKCNETVIWLIQAGLFWLGHLYCFGEAPYSFWIIVPLGGLVLGLLAWRSRSITTSMIAHGIINSIYILFPF